MKTLFAISALTIATCASSAYADSIEETTGTFKQHTFGVSIASGGAKYKGSSADGDGVAHIYGHYNFNFNKAFSLEVGVAAGSDLDDWDCEEVYDDEWECRSDNDRIFGLAANELYYGNLVFAIKGELELSPSNSLYAKVGGNFYDYQFERYNIDLDSDDGVGAFLEAGWQFKWQSGWGINAGFQHMDMGDLDVTSLNVGGSFSF